MEQPEPVLPHPIELAYSQCVAKGDTARAESVLFELLRLFDVLLAEGPEAESFATRNHRLMYECWPFILTVTGGMRILFMGPSLAEIARLGHPAVRILFEEGPLNDQAKRLGFSRNWVPFPPGKYHWPWAPSEGGHENRAGELTEIARVIAHSPFYNSPPD